MTVRNWALKTGELKPFSRAGLPQATVGRFPRGRMQLYFSTNKRNSNLIERLWVNQTNY
jgi:hypothetical protein